MHEVGSPWVFLCPMLVMAMGALWGVWWVTSHFHDYLGPYCGRYVEMHEKDT